MRLFLQILLLSLVVTTLGQARALAEPDATAEKVKVAKQYVDAGLAAQGSGDYETAITLYSKAYQLVPHPVLIFNLAQANRLAGHIDEALALYARYLAEDPKGAQARTARGLVAELEARKAEQARKARKVEPARTPHARAIEEDGEEPAGRTDASGARKSPGEPIKDSPKGETLVVKARTQSGTEISGTVMVDDEPRGELAHGKLTVKALAEGRHTVAIEADGYRRFEETVTVKDGERASVDAVLRDKVEPASPSPSGSLHTVWKVSLAASVVATVAGAVYAGHSYSRELAWFDQQVLQVKGPLGRSVTSGDCGLDYETTLVKENVTSFNFGALERACTWHSRIYVSFAVAGVGALGAIASLILLTRDTGPADTATAAVRGRQRTVAIAPIVTPGGGGAVFSLAW
jgi:tetratricopeptide (TPR) repeat protein